VTTPILSPEKLDALQELVNIGMGTAGAALATVVVLAGAVWPAIRASRLDASEVLRSE